MVFVQKFTDQTMTSVSKDDPWFQALNRATDKHEIKIDPRIFPAGTDSRYIREIGIPAFGFSPMNFTPVCFSQTSIFNVTCLIKKASRPTKNWSQPVLVFAIQ
jgi:hypothetical protein